MTCYIVVNDGLYLERSGNRTAYFSYEFAHAKRFSKREVAQDAADRFGGVVVEQDM